MVEKKVLTTCPCNFYVLIEKKIFKKQMKEVKMNVYF